MPRRLRIAAGARVGLLLLASAGAACVPEPEGPPAVGPERLPSGTPVVLVSVDTLRSDRLPAYGYDGVETPAIDALRSESVLFEHAFAPTPLTLPSHASLLTGEVPPVHGVRENLGYQLRTDGLVSLPETLRQAGYRTGAAVSALVLAASTGLSHGFETYEDDLVARSWAEVASAQRPGTETLESALAWLDSVAGEPFFLFFHIYEPHQPWTPPEPFASRYGRTYDAEVAAADRVVGDLVAALRERGVYERALLIFTSDHGEGLGDHEELEHGLFVYREALQVPLLMKLPGGALGGTSVEAPAQLMDVPPTVFRLLGLEVERELPGTPLLELAAGGGEARALYGETYFPRLHFGWSELLSLIEYPYHLIQGPDPELYDLRQDPAESRDLADEERRVYARLRDRLASVEQRFDPPEEADPALREKLAALGYVGSIASPASGPLPDPKSKIHVLERLRDAFARFGDHDYEAAAAAFRAVLADEPGLIDAWETLGHALLRLDRPEEALAAYRELFERSGGSPHAAIALAGAEIRLGLLDEAEAHAELAAESYPIAHDLLAQIALRRGNPGRAAHHATLAERAHPSHPGPLVTRAEVALARGRSEEALELTRRAEATGPAGLDPETVRGLWTVRGRALADLGRAEEAVAAFEREISRFPGELGAYTHLALVHALSGDGAATRETLRRMVEENPTPAAYAEAARTLEILGDGASARRLLEHARSRWPDHPVLAAPGGD